MGATSASSCRSVESGIGVPGSHRLQSPTRTVSALAPRTKPSMLAPLVDAMARTRAPIGSESGEIEVGAACATAICARMAMSIPATNTRTCIFAAMQAGCRHLYSKPGIDVFQANEMTEPEHLAYRARETRTPRSVGFGILE